MFGLLVKWKIGMGEQEVLTDRSLRSQERR